MKKLLLSSFAVAAMAAQAQVAPTWTSKPTNFPLTSTYPVYIEARDANVAWTFGGDGDGVAPVQNLQVYSKTSNGGATWTAGSINLGNSALSISDITGVSASTAWVAVNGTNGGVWKTADGGATWQKQTTAVYNLATSFPNVIYFWDANNGMVMGDTTAAGVFEIYTTTNGGTNWTKVPASSIPAAPDEYAYVHMKAVAGNTIWFGTDLGRVFKSNDRGLTWTAAQTPIVDFGGVTTAGESGTIALKDANTGWVLSGSGDLYSTTDAGATWNPVNVVSGTIFSQEIVYVPGTARTLITASASGLAPGSSISYDGGAHWTTIDTKQRTALAAYDGSTVYGGEFSSTTTGMAKLSPVLATIENNGVKSVSVYPNPTKGELNVTSKAAVKSIEVSDLSGRIVKTYSGSERVDLSNLKAGLYMVNVLTADGKSTVTKVVKK